MEGSRLALYMQPIIKYSKPSVAVIKNKTSFFEENEKHLLRVQEVNQIYKKQPRRHFCKNCGSSIGSEDIIVQNIEYSICEICHHFNGIYEDTEEFAKMVYSDDDGKDYANNYLENYENRVKEIYLPKVEFLQEVLKKYKLLDDLSIKDIGCGAGHFIKACEIRGLLAEGYDTNKKLINLGSEKLTKNKIIYKDLNNINHLIKENNSKVLALIGVLEHLMRPLDALKAFNESNATILYLQVPLFSFSVLLESMNDDVFPRQLNTGHTHLYTYDSIKYFCNKFNLNIIGEWWFGTDMVDMYRHLLVKVKSNENKKKKLLIQKFFGDFIDTVQNSIDATKQCSGVNMVLQKKS